VVDAAPDLVIVGAGPAGVSTALWAASLDLRPRVLEAAPHAGGQLHRIHFEPRNLVDSFPGDGPKLAARAEAQLAAAAIDVRYATPARALVAGSEGPPRVITEDGVSHSAPAVVIATGLSRRRLEVEGEREFEGRGVTDSATRDREQLAGRDVIVIGGGDAAFENALLLTGAGCHVTLAVRGPLHARRTFRAQVEAEPAIEMLREARALAILGDDRVRAVRFETPDGIVERRTEAVVVKIGQVPVTAWCRGTVDLDEDGYVKVDADLRTSRPAVWAAGDVARPIVPGIALALGHGATIAAAIRRTVAQ
jgi:thioredoxin reductase (NADPH)